MNDSTQALALIDALSTRQVLADKGYDSHAILDAVRNAALIPSSLSVRR